MFLTNWLNFSNSRTVFSHLTKTIQWEPWSQIDRGFNSCQSNSMSFFTFYGSERNLNVTLCDKNWFHWSIKWHPSFSPPSLSLSQYVYIYIYIYKLSQRHKWPFVYKYTQLYIYIYIYIYIYMCVCVCVCVCVRSCINNSLNIYNYILYREKNSYQITSYHFNLWE